jgi:hypothetical protein
MATKGIGTRKATAAAPAVRVFELTFAHELLFARVEAFVTLAVMLASEGFATHAAYKGTLVRMGAKMGP